jgi:hypothetical protein
MPPSWDGVAGATLARNGNARSAGTAAVQRGSATGKRRIVSAAIEGPQSSFGSACGACFGVAVALAASRGDNGQILPGGACCCLLPQAAHDIKIRCRNACGQEDATTNQGSGLPPGKLLTLEN